VRAHVGIPHNVHGVPEEDHLDLKDGLIVEYHWDNQEQPFSQHHNRPVEDGPSVSSKVNVGVHIFIFPSYIVALESFTVVREHSGCPERNAEGEC